MPNVQYLRISWHLGVLSFWRWHLQGLPCGVVSCQVKNQQSSTAAIHAIWGLDYPCIVVVHHDMHEAVPKQTSFMFFHIVHPGHMKQPRRTNTFHQLKSTKSCKATRSRHDHCSVSITQAMGNWHNNCPCLYEQPILIHFTRSHGLSTRFLLAQIDILTPKNRGVNPFLQWVILRLRALFCKTHGCEPPVCIYKRQRPTQQSYCPGHCNKDQRQMSIPRLSGYVKRLVLPLQSV